MTTTGFRCFFRDFEFVTHGKCRYDHCELFSIFWNVRQHFKIRNLRSILFPSKGPMWTVWSRFSCKNICWLYGPYIFGRKSIYRSSVSPFLEESPYMNLTVHIQSCLGHLRDNLFLEHVPGKMKMVTLELKSKQALFFKMASQAKPLCS